MSNATINATRLCEWIFYGELCLQGADDNRAAAVVGRKFCEFHCEVSDYRAATNNNVGGPVLSAHSLTVSANLGPEMSLRGVMGESRIIPRVLDGVVWEDAEQARIMDGEYVGEPVRAVSKIILNAAPVVPVVETPGSEYGDVWHAHALISEERNAMGGWDTESVTFGNFDAALNAALELALITGRGAVFCDATTLGRMAAVAEVNSDLDVTYVNDYANPMREHLLTQSDRAVVAGYLLPPEEMILENEAGELSVVVGFAEEDDVRWLMIEDESGELAEVSEDDWHHWMTPASRRETLVPFLAMMGARSLFIRA